MNWAETEVTTVSGTRKKERDGRDKMEQFSLL
jgi:hypothetical protein